MYEGFNGYVMSPIYHSFQNYNCKVMKMSDVIRDALIKTNEIFVNIKT